MNAKTAKKLRRQAEDESIGLTKQSTRKRYRELKKLTKANPAQFVKPVESKRQSRLAAQTR